MDLIQIILTLVNLSIEKTLLLMLNTFTGLPQQSDNLTAGGVKEDLHVQRQEEWGHLRDQRRRGLRDQEVQGAGLH